MDTLNPELKKFSSSCLQVRAFDVFPQTSILSGRHKNMIQEIQVNVKRLGKEENFDGLKVLTLLVGILVKAALFPW